MNLPAGGASSDLRTGAPAPHDDQVLAQSLHMLLLVNDEAAAQSHQDDDRRDSPDEPKHGEERPHLVRPERGHGLSKDFGESHVRALKFQGFKVSRFQGGTPHLETLKL